MYRWYDGLAYDEIAQRLGTTEGAVRVIVTRALKTLRSILAQP
jgi:DNA-directed RNA polymerase specialized sigma24 family protein